MKKLAFSALVLFCLNAQADQEFIINGHFNDNFAASTYAQTGWTVNSNAYFFEGHAYWEGAVGSVGSLSQNVVGAHGSAVLSFDFSSSSGYQSVVWNGVTLDTVFGPSNQIHFTYIVQATGNDTLTFLGRNDPSYNKLSNVSLMAAVPEPETYGMLLAGLGLVGAIARRKMRT